MRSLLGLALAPFVAAGVVALAEPGLMGTRSFHVVTTGGSYSGSYQRSPSLVYQALITGGIVTVLGALPACVVFRQRQWSRLSHYVGLGALLGAAPFLIYFAFVIPALLVNGPLREPEVLKRLGVLMTLGAIAGATAATTFWAIAIRSGSSQLAEVENSEVGIRNS
jgi:hypothetical protein